MEPLPRLNVLVVEDDPLQREAIAAFLLALGQRPILTENGDEALTLFARKRPDLVLMDVLLPTIDGFETTRRMRTTCSDRWIPIVFLTVLGGTEKLVEGLAAGGDDYLVKPVNMHTLEAKLRSVIRTLGLYRQLEDSYDELKRANEALQRTNHELDTFAYSVAHDLKAPIRAITGYASLLNDEDGAALSAAGLGHLEHIRSSAEHMTRLIDDMLVYARIERGPLNLDTFELTDLVQRVLSAFAPAIASTNAAVDYARSRGEVTADRAGLQHILNNLIGNAFKFTSNVVQPRITIAHERLGRMDRISVRDNGIGFDMKQHDHIFELFKRLHRAEQYPGTGVGLAIVRKAAQRMNGRVWAESAPNAGATFFVEWPAA